MVQLKQFDKYQILRKLGRSMTDVYLAFDPAAKRRVVLKLVEQSRDEFTQIVIEAERRGAQIQKQLYQIDPRILEIYDFGESSGCFFVAMEHFEGRNIAQILQADRRLTPERAARYAIEVLNQLERLHSFVSDVDGRGRAVVHGDIKPSNIQIGAGDRLRLLDFGIAKVITSTRGLTRHNLGSPTYCSPERLANGQVDAQADLWALGVSLHEMVAGSLPYQAQSTRRLENLIRSRRPPRALPSDCPARLRAILAKALAADIGRRYASATAFETDLRAFVENHKTIAEKEVQPSWDANETIQKAPSPATTKGLSSGTRPGMVPRLMDHISDARVAVPALRRSFASGAWSIGAGMLLGLFLVAPLSYFYSVHRASRSILAADFPHLSAAEITSDWKVYKRLERENSFLAEYSPMTEVAETLRAKLMSAADAVIERYRNSSDASLPDFDWAKARLCLSYARQLDGNDREARGKLALCDGYLNLIANPKLPEADLSETNFEIAAGDLPSSPDPHLALARLFTYAFRNAGKAKSEFTEAERRGFRPGPRELKQEADAYVFRAEWELRQGQRAVATSKTDGARWLRQASNDLDRARGIYEPIVGFFNVSDALDQLYQDRGSLDQLHAQLDPPPEPKPKPKRAARRKTVASMIHANH